jgi:hypothetical protein
MADSAGDPTIARLFITSEALHLSSTRIESEYGDLRDTLRQMDVLLSSLAGLEYEECVCRFGDRAIRQLIQSLGRSELGWFVRGVWGDAPVAQDRPSVLDRPIYVHGFGLSLRSLNGLASAGLRTVGQIAAQTEVQLLGIRNLGHKSVNELKRLLSELGLEFGSRTDSPRKAEASPWWDVNLYLLLPTKCLKLGTPLVEQLEKRGLLYVGDLARCSSRSLIHDHKILVGRRVQIERALLRVCMVLGEPFPDWQWRHLAELREFFAGALRQPSTARDVVRKTPYEAVQERLAGVTCLEDELFRLASTTCAERAARTGMRYLGWDGKGGTTLEQTSSEVGLTRERIRQIRERIVNKLKPLALRPPLLVRALEAVIAAPPCRAVNIEQWMCDQQISKTAFRVEGVLSAAAALGLEAPVVVRPFGNERLLLRKGEENDVDNLVSGAVDLAQRRGVAWLCELAFHGDSDFLRAVLGQSDSLEWLDEGREWFWSPRARGNRILSRVRQILTTVPDILIDHLRAALLLKEGIADSQLPMSVLRSLLERQPWCRFEGNLVMQEGEAARRAARNSAEFCMVQTLAENGGALYIEDFVQECERRGVTRGAIEVVRSGSALIQFESGICRLPGTTNIPAMESRRQAGVILEPAPAIEGANGVLDTCSPASVTFIEDAAVKLLARAEALGCRVWSLIELSLTESDIERLRTWGRVGTIDFRRLGARGTDALGLVFTGYCMEIARRDATEGEMWPQVYASLGPVLRALLFVKSGWPRPRVRDAMERACRRFRLRHVFGSEGAQAWLRTVYLQFGITDAGWKRLPWWLSGHSFPIAVYDLLREESAVHSESFAELWHALQEFRWGALTRTEARTALADNPWISGVGVDRALDFAASHREVERTDEAPVPENESLLAAPRLSWRGDEPCFEINLVRHLPGWMTAPRYVLALGSIARLQVYRNDEGEYEIDGGPVVLAPEGSAIVVDLLENGVSVLREPYTLEFYAAEEEIAAFDLATGRKLNIWEPIPVERPCALLCAPDITLNPPAKEVRFLFAGRRQLSVYRQGIPQMLNASLEGEPLWSPVEAALTKAFGGNELVARCRGGYWSESAPVEMQLDSEMHVRKLRVGTQVLGAVSLQSGVARFEPVTLTPELDGETHAVLEILRDGQLRRIPVRFEIIPAYGAALESGGKWQILHKAATLDKSDFTGRRLFVRPPAFFDDQSAAPEDWALLEGTNFCGRPRGINRDLNALLHGFGEPLELGLGPYNKAGDRRLTVARAITNFGSVKSATRSGDNWVIEFRHGLEPGAAHVWSWGDCGLVHVTASAVEWCATSCKIESSALPEAPVVLGLAFEGICVGAAVTEDAPYAQLCSLIEGASDWEGTAACLRWFRLPLLNDTPRRSVASRIAGNACCTLLTWTSAATRMPPDLRQEDASNDHWQYVLRRFFEKWHPSPTEAGLIVRHFELLTGDPPQDFDQCWERHDELLDIHPVLLAAIANLGVAAVYPAASPYEHRVFLDMLINLVLDLGRNTGESDRRRSEQKCLQDAAESMSVDVAFIERGLLGDARRLYQGAPVRTRNLRIALAVRPFRQWLAARLI